MLFGDGPLLIVAGAGTGKTTTLACRVGHLVERGVRPERILLLTFSRRAAREMLSRAQRATGQRETERVWGGTFHAVANRLLRLHGRPLGLRPDFTVLDQSDGADVMNLLREELGFATRERRFPRKDTLASIYSRTVNAGEKLPDVLKRHYPWCVDEIDGIRQVFQAYTVRKRDQNVLDYDDLLLFWKALATAPQTRDALASMFDHVLVDEYQDTNALQADILEGMRPPDTPRNLTVVGDDAQSIYGFRAATVRNILEFPTQVRRRRRDPARAELPIDPADPRRRRTRPSSSRRSVTRRRCGPRGTARDGRSSARAWTRPSSATSSAGACCSTARRAYR